ncbi:hypothetical protein [Peribacillus deserti]|uniref:Bacitracin ABC transporter ATP-binding protein n=1 Tax=Peribacillus deserti TaxID=673318 RepID=A0A2N5M8S5_9BACI|nr:hypothetical protein [Peribacillus deserti]PLT30745.1 bacitracin ABC transporter ATP-binding protein [Peribacillus deserti]
MDKHNKPLLSDEFLDALEEEINQLYGGCMENQDTEPNKDGL